MQEQRISVRTSLLGVNARVSKDGREWFDIKAKDISDGGMSFTATAVFSKGAKLTLEGEASDVSKRMDISCEVEVVFNSPVSDGKFLYGVKFIDLSHAHKIELSIFVELMIKKYPDLLFE